MIVEPDLGSVVGYLAGLEPLNAAQSQRTPPPEAGLARDQQRSEGFGVRPGETVARSLVSLSGRCVPQGISPVRS